MTIAKKGQAFTTKGHVPCQMGYDPDGDVMVNRHLISELFFGYNAELVIPLGGYIDSIGHLHEVDHVHESRGYSFHDQSGTWRSIDHTAVDQTISVPAAIEIDIFHAAIHLGLGFEVAHHIDVANSAAMSISFTTPARGTQIHMLTEFDSEAEADFEIREGVTLTDSGTARTPTNRNRYLASIPTSAVLGGAGAPHTTANTVTVDATLNGVGTVINGGGHGHHIGVGKFAGGSAEANHEYILRPATMYMFEFHNLTVSNNEMYMNLSWFEVPDPATP